MTQQPFDGDRARAQADIPQQLALARRQCRHGDSADLALGELAVMLEQRVVEAGRERQHRRVRGGRDLQRDGVERRDIDEIEAGGGRRAHAFARDRPWLPAR